jgi:hypothetical protein
MVTPAWGAASSESLEDVVLRCCNNRAYDPGLIHHSSSLPGDEILERQPTRAAVVVCQSGLDRQKGGGTSSPASLQRRGFTCAYPSPCLGETAGLKECSKAFLEDHLETLRFLEWLVL